MPTGQSAAPVTINTGAPQAVQLLQIGTHKKLMVHVAVEVQALTDFNVNGRAQGNAAFVDFSPTSWTPDSPTGRVQRSSGNLNTLAAASEGYFEMDVEALAELQITAVAAVNGATVELFWNLR